MYSWSLLLLLMRTQKLEHTKLLQDNANFVTTMHQFLSGGARRLRRGFCAQALGRIQTELVCCREGRTHSGMGILLSTEFPAALVLSPSLRASCMGRHCPLAVRDCILNVMFFVMHGLAA